MPRKQSYTGFVERQVALCYIRQSLTRDKDDTNSPERQRANIQAVCERNGWIPEWYEDAKGHRSGRSEKNRPQWLALKARLGDPDVIALVANDLSRLHRKGWRVGDLIDYLNEYNVNLVLAAPGREVDTTTMKGRMFVQFAAIVDEYYAEDISQRAKDHIAYRKSQGKSVGQPPFGAVRDKDSYLTASPEGAWLLPSGHFVTGQADTIPEEGAIWRSYYDAAYLVLQLYAAGNKGLEKIAYHLNDEGWPFQNRNGNPRSFTSDDIRRIVGNWPEYGGLVLSQRSKDRPAYEQISPDDILFKPERAIFPIDLLRQVALVRHERTVRPTDQSVKHQAHPYAFSTILYCAHCARLAADENNPKLHTALTGNTPHEDSIRRYRHKAGVKCGCTNRSVSCEVVEHDFGRLIKLLTIQPDTLDLMTELAIQADKANGIGNDNGEADLEAQKQEAIALCRRRIDAAVVLFGDGMIDKDEYRRRVEANEREIAHWEARTTETQKLALELAMCMSAVDRLARLWDMSDAEDRQGLVRSLFTHITYDLDTQRIVDFRLKPWADRYLILRSALYDDTDETPDDGNTSIGTPDSEATSGASESADTVRNGLMRQPCRGISCSMSSPTGAVLFSGVVLPFSSSSYKAARNTTKRSAHGLSLKSTIRRMSKS